MAALVTLQCRALSEEKSPEWAVHYDTQNSVSLTCCGRSNDRKEPFFPNAATCTNAFQASIVNIDAGDDGLF